MGTGDEGRHNPSLQLCDAMTKLILDDDTRPWPGTLVYNAEDFSFDTLRRTQEGESSLLVNDLQIELDEESRLLFVWGLCPASAWNQIDAAVPPAKPGVLRLEGGPMIPGTSRRLNAESRWSVGVNSGAGWVCVGDESAHGDVIQVGPGAVAVLDDGKLRALWLRPVVLPQKIG